MKRSKFITYILMTAFVLGIAGGVSAATIKALKVQGNIPLDPTDPFWSQYGPTKGKHVTVDMDPQMITNPMWPNPSTKWVNVNGFNPVVVVIRNV